MTALTVRTIDLGFGTSTVVTQSGKEFKYRTFPSIAAPLEKGKSDITAGAFSRSDVVKVDVDGVCYAVGEDVYSFVDGANESRVFNSTFIKSKQYKAVFLASLSMMADLPLDENGSKVIDLLAMGLPVNNMHLRDELNDFAKSTHVLPDGSQVVIREAWTVAQPLGGLLYYGVNSKEGLSTLLNKRILTCDPGMGTFDWLTSHGLNVFERRSGSNEYGLNKILSAVSDAAKPVFGLDLLYDTIDRAIYQKHKVLSIAGRKYPFPRCEGKFQDGTPALFGNKPISFDFSADIKRVTDSASDSLRNNVGDGQDIDLILVTGGPAEVYLKSISELYPLHAVELVPNSIVANALGIHQAAVQKADKLFAA
ncbi:hypothetical protein [Motilimonas eburnea]|uniref:ParM/StbA family protein n=1 Tax=Motilimonas eburnea TaxID=1737488 RepID=UPI001E4F4CAA|nr:hypothetical protein [Motilimonas eburnea]MCE2571776.1 hypothetical protein [Motilimonas eburnea]